MMLRSSLLRVAVTLISFGLVAGCGGGGGYDGPPRAAVQGKVTLDGQPVKYGTITFVPEDRLAYRTASGVIVDGNYNITEGKGPNLAKYHVVISATPVTAPAGDGEERELTPEEEAALADEERVMEYEDDEGERNYDAEAANGSGDDSGPFEEFVPPKNILPAKFSTDTELTAEIASSHHVFDFPLTSE